MMFRAIKNYDGSDSDKRITLRVGDSLSGVHALDDTWFIGHNNRTGETGAFPIECVEDSQIDENIQGTGIFFFYGCRCSSVDVLLGM